MKKEEEREKMQNSKLSWNKLLTEKAFKEDDDKKARPIFQRDAQRTIYDKTFRRLSRKTQVHPVVNSEEYESGTINDHTRNRLFHSSEVAVVAKSLVHHIFTEILSDKNKRHIGNINEYLELSKAEFEQYMNSKVSELIKHSFISDLQDIIASASYLHDIGNPPFGHGGEYAIKEWFKSRNISKEFNHFDGNAQAVRIAINELKLSYPAIASMVKYPWFFDSVHIPEDYKGKDKFAYFKDDADNFHEAFNTLGLFEGEIGGTNKYIRHPLSYILEMADDICYCVTDWIDAYELDYVNTTDIIKIFEDIANKLPNEQNSRTKEIYQNIQNKVAELNFCIKNESDKLEISKLVSKLSSKVVDILVKHATADFINNYENIMNGVYIELKNWSHHKAIDETKHKKEKLIYTQVNKDKDIFDNRIQFLLDKYILENKCVNKNDIADIHKVIDYISGMTDAFATRAYYNYPLHKYKKPR